MTKRYSDGEDDLGCLVIIVLVAILVFVNVAGF